MPRLLSTLNPKWLGLTRKDSGEGVGFDCPACGSKHFVAVYFQNPIDGKPSVNWPNQTRWAREGETFEVLTLTASTGRGASIEMPCWHGWLEDGKLTHISEATHSAKLLNTATGKVETAALSPRQVAALRAEGKIH